MSPAERTDLVRRLDLPDWRVQQISRHYFTRREADPSTWTDLPGPARAGLAASFPELARLVTQTSADAGLTVKQLYRLADQVLVECVLMRYPKRSSGPVRQGDGSTVSACQPRHRSAVADLGWAEDETPSPSMRTTLCVSSQAGCGIGCPFCATGQAGLQRNLSAGEILEQVRLALVAVEAGHLPGGPGHLNNLVFMGMGEPLANYAAVLAAVRAITGGFGLTARGITISTAGVVPRLADLAGEGLPLTLAVSLHAPDDELRDRLVPINRRWPVGPLLDAARSYFEATGRRVSIEYALMRDINDQPWRADQLARALLARGRGWAHVNLIPLNPTPGSIWTASRARDQANFVARLAGAGLAVTVRDTRGRDIDGACGQLAARMRQDLPGAVG